MGTPELSSLCTISHDQSYTDCRTVSTDTVSDLVQQYPGSTSRELAEKSGLCRMMIARRLPEAEKLKKGQLVWKGRPRPCDITERMAITWWDREVKT